MGKNDQKDFFKRLCFLKIEMLLFLTILRRQIIWLIYFEYSLNIISLNIFKNYVSFNRKCLCFKRLELRWNNESQYAVIKSF
jgi:hypothetical protein